MKLTDQDKDQFVVAVMCDIPRIDYRAKAEQVLTADAVAQMPKELGALYEKHMQYFSHKSFWAKFGVEMSAQFLIPSPAAGYKRSEEARREFEELGRLSDQQRTTLNNIDMALTAVMNKCPTLDHALDNLPKELHKYLPARRKGATSNAWMSQVKPAYLVNDGQVDVPALLDAMKAQGWKGGE